MAGRRPRVHQVVSGMDSSPVSVKAASFPCPFRFLFWLTDTLPEKAGGTILLAPDAGTKTLLHETSHELMHQDDDRPKDKAILELEAESVAYVVGRHFSLEGLSSPNYGDPLNNDSLLKAMISIGRCGVGKRRWSGSPQSVSSRDRFVPPPEHSPGANSGSTWGWGDASPGKVLTGACPVLRLCSG